MTCPKCGNEWIVNHVIVEVQGFRKHWWESSRTVSYHEAYPNEPPYYCSQCGNKWGKWHESREHYINPQQVGQIKEAII